MRAFRDKLVDDLISLATLKAGRESAGTSAAVAHGAEDVACSGHGEPYSESDGEPELKLTLQPTVEASRPIPCPSCPI